jgi:hypothetical protein
LKKNSEEKKVNKNKFLWVNKINFFFNFISLQIIIYDYYDFGLNRKYVDKGSINRKNNIIE